MSKKRDIKILLQDIEECAQKILRYTQNYSYDNFLNDDKTIDAVVRNFEIIGEASSKIDEDFKTKNSHIEWIRMKGLRNRMIHDYSGIDYELIWDIIENHLEELEYQITKLIQET